MVKGFLRRLDEAQLVSPKLMAKIGFFLTLFVARASWNIVDARAASAV
jgi:hypothetical protein